MTSKISKKIIGKFLSNGYKQDGKPRTEEDKAILIAMKALDNMIYLEEQMGEKDRDIEI